MEWPGGYISDSMTTLTQRAQRVTATQAWAVRAVTTGGSLGLRAPHRPRLVVPESKAVSFGSK